MSEAPKREAKKVVRNRKPASIHSGWYSFARFVMKLLTHTVAPIRYEGWDQLPTDTQYIILSNHKSMMDPIILGMGVKDRQLTFLGKKELTHNPLLSHILQDMHMILVDRHNSDMEAMRTCLKALKDGESLGIFPEGTRHREGVMQELESGVALIAMRSNVPLIPVLIQPRYRWFHRTRCIMGKPIDYSDLLSEGINKETSSLLLQRIRDTYREMLAEAEKNS